MDIEIKQLCHQIAADFDECISKLLQEEREMVGEEDKLNHLKSEIESLKRRKARQTEEMHTVSDEVEELSHRLKFVQSELHNNESANEGQKETLKYLMMEVVEMEHEKENRIDKMKKDYTSRMKLWKIYKAYLDMRIALVKPDMYRISFSASKGAPTSLTLQSFPDLKDWEVMEVNGKPELEEELRAYLAETYDILGVMCKARRSCRKWKFFVNRLE